MDKGNKQMRFTEPELKLIKDTFGGNEVLLRLLRKVFLPEYNPDAPLGQNVDLWMTLDVRDMTPEAAYVRILARNELMLHVETQLMQLDALAGIKTETPEERVAREKRNSMK
jgi:hypothetical protein